MSKPISEWSFARRRTGALLATIALALVCAAPNRAEYRQGGEAAKSPMEQRLDQQLRIVAETDSPEAFRAAVYGALEELTANRVPVVTKGLEEQTAAAAKGFTAMATRVAKVLGGAVDRFPQIGGEVVNVKRTVEHWIEMNRAISAITRRCGEGDSVAEPPCDELVPLLDEETGHEIWGGGQDAVIRAPYTLKLRGPHIPRGYASWEEDVTVTEAIAAGECVAIFKETRGLMLRLRLERIIIVNDPWVSVFGVPRGTKIPIWTLEFVPSQYGKTWNICNHGKGLQTTVSQRVKQDLALNYFWRFYPKAR